MCDRVTVLVSDPDLTIHVGDALDVLRTMPDGSVNCCVTSPPYWGLRDYGADGQLGLEATPDAYVAAMVAVFREVRRVLADDGTLWLNLGSSYNSNESGGMDGSTLSKGGKQTDSNRIGKPRAGGFKPKDMVPIPWMIAMALQADGWYLRADIIWAKKNCMPESVTDRPTKAHEYVFLLSKSPRYWFDQEAVREPHSPDGRNVRSVWEIATQPYPETHFATFPEALPRRCILAGCPEWVCGTCGKPRERVTDGASYYRDRDTSKPNQKYAAMGLGHGGVGRGPKSNLGASIAQLVGWSDCGHGAYVPGTVLDPFFGSGTTGLVARKHGRRCVGIELNPEYARLAAQRCQQLSLLATVTA